MKAGETTFEHLVQGQKQFQVPLYQRPYSWTKKELRQLWDDILEQADALRDGVANTAHFLGSVVLAPSPSMQASGVQRWLVIDGQQRLTTLMLALSAIRDHRAETESERERERIDDLYLTNKYQDGDDRLRLLPTQADREAFRRAVLRIPGAEDASNVGDAYRYFRAVVATADDPEDPHDVARIEQVILKHLSMVEVACEPSDNTHRIFESLNNTGLRLTQADLLRNYLFMLLPSRAERLYEQVWLPMQELLDPEELERLAWLDLILRGDQRARRSDVYEGQKRRMETAGLDEDSVETALRELAERAHIYGRIVDPSRETSADVREAIERLHEWEAQRTYPLLLRLMEIRERGQATDEEVVRAMRYIESFLVRRMLANIAPNSLPAVFGAVALEVDGSQPVDEQVRHALSNPRRRWPRDEDVRDAVRTKPFYWQGRARQRKVVMKQLERSFGSREPIDLDADTVTIEHVLPQQPSDLWWDVLREDVEGNETVDDVHKSVVHTLGNLTLTGYNASLGNAPFHDKREKLRRSGMRMTEAIVRADRWGRPEILKRADDLAERIIDIWPGPLGDVSAGVADETWRKVRELLAGLPAGAWTTYGDVAEVVGTHPVALGRFLATQPVPNAWRVLRFDGSISPGFTWAGSRSDDPHDVLREEGVRFDQAGRADPSQRFTAEDLAVLLDLEVPSDEAAVSRGQDDIATFTTQLRTHRSAETVHAVEDVVAAWRRLGGVVRPGKGVETALYLNLEDPDRRWSMLSIWPQSGVVEIPFQWLASKSPWDSPELRDELRRDLNRLPGVQIEATKLKLRPNFPLDALISQSDRQVLIATLEWFVNVTRGSAVQG